MTRNLKALALILIATSAVLVSHASAQFESEAASSTWSVSSNEIQKFAFNPSSSKIECSKLVLDNATQTGTATTTVTVEPTYSSCEDVLGLEVTIDTNGCDYEFHLSDNSTTGSADVECPSAFGIQITLGKSCWYRIPAQSSIGSFFYTNVGTSSTREVTVEPNVSDIVITRTTSDLPFNLCPTESIQGIYSGDFTVTGSSGSSHVGLFVD